MAGVPLLIAISMSISLILDRNQVANRAMLDGEIVNLALSYDDLAHNLAVERGLTAGVLGSKGNRKHLVQQIEQTQTCMSELENDARSVSNIVDTISGISEQTFLVWCGLRFSGLSRVVSFIF